MFAKIKQWWHTNQIVKQTVKELSELSDRDLADLGISRNAIRDAAYRAAQGAR